MRPPSFSSKESSVVFRVVAISAVFLSLSCSRFVQTSSRLNETAVCFSNTPAAANQDGLTELFSGAGRCAKDAIDLRAMMIEQGMILKTSFINNRGFHNPSRGSFSLFETMAGNLGDIAVADGEFFFGHFTAPKGRLLVADQEPGNGALMVELIAWDYTKKVFNFYELIGTGTAGRWFYRGDSFDILEDTKKLHLAGTGQANFGGNLRCSGCHVNGGPIMKEGSSPHNDWWSLERPLPLGGKVPDEKLAAILAGVQDASVFSTSVDEGVEKLLGSASYSSKLKSLTLQEQLRPLFCAQEINFESDLLPFDLNVDSIVVPETFLLNPITFEPTVASLTIDSEKYSKALRKFNSKFPENNRIDGHHAFLGPVKAMSDLSLITKLVDSGVVDQEFVADVLAIDASNPVLSETRCKLLRSVPVEPLGDWHTKFIENLILNGSPQSLELVTNITDATKTATFHKENASDFLANCRQRSASQDGVDELVAMLAQRRLEISANALSSNPRGQILEPGFRLIFPVMAADITAGKFTLDASCKMQLN